MATNYYVDPSINWLSTQTGLATGTAMGGFAGFKKMLSTYAAGDAVYVRGGTFAAPKTIDHIKYVTATTTSDHSATWLVGHVVRNYTGSGDDWTGTIYSIAAKVIGVSLDTGNYTTVATADKIENVTLSENDTFTKTAATYCALVTAGTSVAQVNIIACDDSWTARAGFVKIKSYTADRCLNGSTNGYHTFYGFIFDSNLVANCSGVVAAGQGMKFHRCYVKNHVRNAFNCSGAYCEYRDCIITGNTDSSYSNFATENSVQKIIRCKIIGSADSAIVCGAGYHIINCIIHDSGKNHIVCTNQSNTLISGCVLDKTGAGYSAILLNTASQNSYIFGNRITNAAMYGIECSDATDTSIVEDYNYFQSNSSGSLLNITAGANSGSGSDTDCGYISSADHNFNLRDDATMRRTAIDLDWDQ